MRLIRSHREPFGSILPLQREVNRVFESFFGDDDDAAAGSWPSVDVVDSSDAVVVKVEAPGVDPKDLDISVTDQVLTVRGEKREEREEKDKTWYRREISAGAFSRSIPLPASVDADRIDAQCRNGIVTIRMPKRETSKAKKIQVKSS